MNENKAISLLKKGDKTILKEIYKNHKDSFFKYAYRFSLTNEDLVDIYQDATIALYENALNGKMDNLKCSVKTYLFSIGKNMIYEQLRKDKKAVLVNTDMLKDEYDEEIVFDNESLNNYQLKLQNGFKLLGEQCKKILTLFYYNGYTLDEIKVSLNYDKKDVVKSQKSRCLAKLKSIINN